MASGMTTSVISRSILALVAGYVPCLVRLVCGGDGVAVLLEDAHRPQLGSGSGFYEPEEPACARG